jgi:hypothetical protein
LEMRKLRNKSRFLFKAAFPGLIAKSKRKSKHKFSLKQ